MFGHDHNGKAYSSEDAPFVWIHPDITTDGCKFVKSKLLSADLCPKVNTPFPSNASQLLCELSDLLEECEKHNFIAALVTIGAAIQTFHYETIIEPVIEHYGGCPITVLMGPPETGKTKAILSSLSLFGATEGNYFVKGTNSFFIDRSAESTLPYVIDDPNLKGNSSKTNFLDLNELIIDVYNGAKSANAVKGSKKPHSAPLIATNFDLKSDTR